MRLPIIKLNGAVFSATPESKRFFQRRHHTSLRPWLFTAALAATLLSACGKKAAPPPAAAKANPEIPGRPSLQAITPAQRAFWDYIETFHRLPDSPTELQRRIFATRGDVKPYLIIRTSPTSVFADVAGMKAHREIFSQRYPWVKKLLEAEKITLEVDESVFRGGAKEIVGKHGLKVDSHQGKYYETGSGRLLFAKHWLESLLAVDYIFACGSAQDRKDGMWLLEQAISGGRDAGIHSPDYFQRVADLEIPAVFEIAMPIANEFAQDAPERLVRFMPDIIIGKENAAACIDCLKWSLRVKAFSKWAALMDSP